MLRRMKKRNSNQPVSIHQDHLADLIEVLMDNVAQHKPNLANKYNFLIGWEP